MNSVMQYKNAVATGQIKFKDPLAKELATDFERMIHGSDGIEDRLKRIYEQMYDSKYFDIKDHDQKKAQSGRWEYAIQSELDRASRYFASNFNNRTVTVQKKMGQSNAQSVFNDMLKKMGYTGENLLEKIEEKHKQQQVAGASVSSPFSWEKFNEINALMSANVPPPNLADAFREMLITKAQEQDKMYDEGSIDMSRISEYWRGDIFSLPTPEKRSKVRVYVYRDTSGSMGESLGQHMERSMQQGMVAAGVRDPIKKELIDEIFVSLFDVLHEAQDLGLPIKYGLFNWSDELEPVKEVDEEITITELKKRITTRYRSGGTNIGPVVQHYSQIVPEDATERIIVMVLSDGSLFPTRDFDENFNLKDEVTAWQLIQKHPTPFIHLWIPIGFQPEGESKEIFGAAQTQTRNDVYHAIIAILQRVLDQIYK